MLVNPAAAVRGPRHIVRRGNRRLWVRLHEKGGKQHAMPCHHNLEAYLHEYLHGAGLANDPKALLFQTYSCATSQLTGHPLPQANAYEMIPTGEKPDSWGLPNCPGRESMRQFIASRRRHGVG
ncbi:MAG: hypothetical protein M3Z96_07070 [Pseudomonadota bacterium]|nr:hypothetical protein [Pseudomonadota bacterium]